MPRKSALPLGVSAVSNRSNLYRLSVMIESKRYSEYYSPDSTLTKRQLQSDLQKTIDNFREKAENGQLDGQITDKSSLDECAKWYFKTAKMSLRESTLKKDKFNYSHYISPALGSMKIKSITPPLVSRFLAEIKDGGGGETYYTATEDFIQTMSKARGDKRLSFFLDEIGISENTYYRLRQAEHKTPHATAEKLCKHFNFPLGKAFTQTTTRKSLSAGYVSSITYTLSGILTALVRANVIMKNPVNNATKPRVGEVERGAFLNESQLPIFQAALDTLSNDNIRIALLLCLQLGLRSGEARGLLWEDIDWEKSVININHNAVDTNKGLAIGEPKTKRSIRTLSLNDNSYLYNELLAHKEKQASYALSLGSAWHDMDLVCPNNTGRILHRGKLGGAVEKIVKQNPALPQDLHPHSLRHSFVSLLIAQNVDIAVVAYLAGDTIAIITKHYTHALNERVAAAMDNVGAIFSRVTPQCLEAV